LDTKLYDYWHNKRNKPKQAFVYMYPIRKRQISVRR